MRHSCDVCGADAPVEIEILRQFTKTPIHVCSGCGFVYVVERRSAAEIATAWNRIFGKGYSASWPAVAARHEYVAEIIRAECPSLADPLDERTILDIGAGEGKFLDRVVEDFEIRHGLDPSPINCGAIAKFHNAIPSTVEHAPVISADIVSVLWTLENTADPRRMIEYARRCLEARKGHLVVATGSRLIVPYKKRLGDYIPPTADDRHATRWSAASLGRFLNSAGFAVDFVNRYQDSDWLVMIARPGPDSNFGFESEDYRKVIAFFEGWAKAWP